MSRTQPHNSTGVSWPMIAVIGLAVMLGVFFGFYLLDRGVSAAVALPSLGLVAVIVLGAVLVRHRARKAPPQANKS